MSIYSADGVALTAAYDADGNELQEAYDADGNVIFTSHIAPELELLNWRYMSILSQSTITPQGFAMYGGYWFQFFTGDNKMRVFRLDDYSLVGEYSATNIGHANVMQFGTVEQDTGFPLLYVSEWGASGSVDSKTIDVLKVSLQGYEIVDSYTLPSSVGYHPNQIIDWENQIAYVIGYANTLTTSEEQPNVVSALRLSDLTVLSQFQVPYLGVANGIEFRDGKILFYGDTWNAAAMRLSYIDPTTQTIIEDQYEKTTNEEFEDCAMYNGDLYLSNWIYDATDGNKLKYRIYRMEFN